MPPNETNRPDESPAVPRLAAGIIKMADGIEGTLRAKRDEYRDRIQSHFLRGNFDGASTQFDGAAVQEMLRMAESRPDALAQRLRLVYKFVLTEALLLAPEETGIHPDSESVQSRIKELCGDRPLDLHNFIHAVSVVAGRASGLKDGDFEYENEIK